ncbi:MAG TPA: YihY family inner membrane protein [Pusillimonas sp.]|uniref:YihY family inner membrane protein n=1 Tax=Pusillimonas sp. TaxID=3040095 RepID=UPI002BA0743D|nr:YihY family inner membrane protein [Pusillimonas sp.]HUH87272.1 YihY family inner membrane protein [Pusillimonas sp.]
MQQKNAGPASSTNTRRARSYDWLGNVGQAARYALQRASEKRLPQIAASLTYTTVLAIVPMLAVVLALFTAFPLFGEFKLALESFLTTSLMPPSVSESVMGYLNQFAAKASGLTAVGTAFLVVVSIMLIMTIDGVLNDIWSVEQRRPLRQRILVYWAIVSLGPILAGASLWTTTVLTQQSLGLIGEMSAGLNLLLSVVPVLITGLGFAALFVYVPNRQVYWRDALVGGVGTAVVLSIMKSGFALYISKFPSYTVIYGAFATLPIFLLWIYLSWLGILLGATVAATLPALRMRRWAEARQPGAAIVDAVSILRLLRSAQGSPSPGRSSRFLSAHLRLHPDELNHLLTTLRSLGWAVPTQDKDKGSDQWVLACDLDEARLGRLVDHLLIDRSQPGLESLPCLLPAIAEVLTSQPDLTIYQLLDQLKQPPKEQQTLVAEENKADQPQALLSESGNIGQNTTRS